MSKTASGDSDDVEINERDYGEIEVDRDYSDGTKTKLQCAHCSATCSKKSTMAKHLDNQHPRYVCYCGYTSHNLARYTAHWQGEHE